MAQGVVTLVDIGHLCGVDDQSKVDDSKENKSPVIVDVRAADNTPPSLTSARSPAAIRQRLTGSRWLLRRTTKFRSVCRNLVGPLRDGRPFEQTVVWTLLCFIIFIVLVSIAARYPRKGMHIAFPIVGFILLISLLTMFVIDMVSGSNRTYRRNLGNTVVTALLTVPTMTLLYVFLWYPRLNQEIVKISEDVITEARFPSVALFQRNDWTSQASLRGEHSKCFVGWYNESAPHCSSLIPEDTGGDGLPCNCNDTWSKQVTEDFMWQGASYRYLSLSSPSNLVCKTPTTLMLLQAFFTYNATQAKHDSSQTLSPSLYLAIYDSNLEMLEALEKGYTRMNLINANGVTGINLGLTYRQAINSKPAYDYDISMSTVPSMELVCDTSSKTGSSYPCHASLFIQIPTFGRKIVQQTKSLTWPDLIASAGAFYSFVQFLSWVISGQALGT